MTIDKNVETLIRVASRLIELMNREVEILKAMRTAEIGPLQNEKAALTTAYEQSIQDLAKEPEALAAVSPALRQEFAKVAESFNQALTANEHALHAARIAHDRLIKAIVEAVTADRTPVNVYSSTGAHAGRGSAGNRAASALALDARL